jgi:hypothetical protein
MRGRAAKAQGTPSVVHGLGIGGVGILHEGLRARQVFRVGRD